MNLKQQSSKQFLAQAPTPNDNLTHSTTSEQQYQQQNETPRTTNTTNPLLQKSIIKDTPIFAGNNNNNSNNYGSNSQHHNHLQDSSLMMVPFQYSQYGGVNGGSGNINNDNQMTASEISIQNNTHHHQQYPDEINYGDNSQLDVEELLKSSQSNLSDYNFLFDQIDQQLETNTQNMAEEIRRNLPDYLMYTNSTVQRASQNNSMVANGVQQEYSVYQEGNSKLMINPDDSFNKAKKDVNIMPKQFIGHPPKDIKISNSNSANQLFKQQQPFTFEQQRSGIESNSFNNINELDISEEMISIEDTYKETANSVYSKKQQQNMNINNIQLDEDGEAITNHSNNIRNDKSMTIIEEESLEESQAMHHINYQSSQVTFHNNNNNYGTRQDSLQWLPSMNQSLTSQRQPLKDTFETFGTNQNQNTPNLIFNTYSNHQRRQSEVMDEQNCQSKGQKVYSTFEGSVNSNGVLPSQSDSNNCGFKIDPNFKILSNNPSSAVLHDHKQQYAPTATATLEDTKSSFTTAILNNSQEKNVKTIANNNNNISAKYTDSNLTTQRESDDAVIVADQGKVGDMLHKYQAKYKKQIPIQYQQQQHKVEPQQQSKQATNLREEIKENPKRVVKQNKSYINEDSSSGSEGEYVNRSFVSGKDKSGNISVNMMKATQETSKEGGKWNQYLKNKVVATAGNSTNDFIDTTEENSRMHEAKSVVDNYKDFQQYHLHIQNLSDELKIQENAKLKAEKILLQERIELKNQIQQVQNHARKQVKIKEKEVEELKNKLETQAEINEQKLNVQRDRIKRVEKTVFERIEHDYSSIIKQKDEQIEQLQSQLEEAFAELRIIKDETQRQEYDRAANEDALRMRERQRMMAERDDLRVKTMAESSKEFSKTKERMQQEMEFKVIQQQSQFDQQIKLMKQQMKNKQELLDVENEEKFQERIQKELQNIQSTKLIDHANTTQNIYEDVSRALQEKMVNTEKASLEKLRSELKQEYEKKIRKIENTLNAQLALERKNRGQTEIANLQLENEVYEIKKQIAEQSFNIGIEKDKENININTNIDKGKQAQQNKDCRKCEALIITNGELVKKMKRINKINTR